MAYTLADIAKALGTDVLGASDIPISGAAEPRSAGPEDLALAMKPEFAEALSHGRARAALLWDGADWQGFGLEGAIVAPRPRYAMSGVTQLLDPGPHIADGVHASAVIDDSAEIADDAAIGPFVCIGPGVRIGSGARIAAQSFVGEDSVIGRNALLLGGVHIGRNVRIGDRFIAQPGAVIGADGFSFVTPDKSRVEAARESLGTGVEQVNTEWTRIHSLGGVEIGDDVEVGANSTIDAGTIRATRIGRGTKIDNLVQVGHNVTVGEDCLLCGQVGIAGSTRVGDRVVLGGQVGVSDNIFIGDDVVAGGGTDIYTNVPAGRTVLGSPAVKMQTELEIRRNLRRLPRIAADVASLKKAVSKAPDSD